MGRLKTITDDEVLAAARRVFQRDGHAASTRDVAQEAGVSQAVLYQRFKTKEELFFAAMTPAVIDPQAIVGAWAEVEAFGPDEHVQRIARRLYLRLREVIPAVLQLAHHPSFPLHMAGSAHGRLGASAVDQAIIQRLAALKDAGLAAGEIDAVAAGQLLVSAMHGLAVHEAVGRQAVADETAPERLARAIWTGLRPG
uniref:TetR/AcrR family transcriptional regulator n=1 Tax=uncultured Caulobacter sp. TaxID=158749 RepID=UPI0025F9C1C7|nr:TetR/AcrR family transcriptional regulator [uncultured Caulobacter sp.]